MPQQIHWQCGVVPNVQMQAQIDPYTDGEFHTGYDERACRAFCGKALFLHFAAANDVDEHEAEPAG